MTTRLARTLLVLLSGAVLAAASGLCSCATTPAGPASEPPVASVQLEFRIANASGSLVATPSVVTVLGQRATVAEGFQRPPGGGPGSAPQCSLSVGALPTAIDSRGAATSVDASWSRCWLAGPSAAAPAEGEQSATWHGTLVYDQWLEVVSEEGLRIEARARPWPAP